MTQQSFLSEAIRSARRRADLSQLQLAELLGVRQSSVSQWERGSTRPSSVHLLALAAVLKASLLDFAAPAAEPESPPSGGSPAGPNDGSVPGQADRTVQSVP
jgi:transcriptional regulator with XRE-family HTH domain